MKSVGTSIGIFSLYCVFLEHLLVVFWIQETVGDF